MLVSSVPISFCISRPWPSLCEAPWLLSFEDENKLTLLHGIWVPSEDGRDTSCSREGRSLPSPHASASTVVHRRPLVWPFPTLLSSLRGSGYLSGPSEEGLCLRWESHLVLLLNQSCLRKWNEIRTHSEQILQTCLNRQPVKTTWFLQLQQTRDNSYKHYDSGVGVARWIGHVKHPPESIGYELKGRGRWGRALALRRFPFLARVCLRLICFGLCVYLIRHQRTGKMQVNLMWN